MRAGDEEFDIIYRAHRDGLFRLGVLICGDPARSEDAVADAFARVLPRWRAGAVEQPVAYLRRALVNGLTGGFRRQAREQRHAQHHWGDGRATVALEADVSERDAIRMALSYLPIGQRAVVALRYYADLSEAETAHVLGLSVGTVKSRTSRAMARLRGILQDAEAAVDA